MCAALMGLNAACRYSYLATRFPLSSPYLALLKAMIVVGFEIYGTLVPLDLTKIWRPLACVSPGLFVVLLLLSDSPCGL